MSDTKGDGFGKEVPEFGPRPGSRHFGAKAQTPARADFKKWARRDWWHVAEGAMLILGVEPVDVRKSDWLTASLKSTERFLDIYETALRSEALRGWAHAVPPRDFLAWAHEKGYRVPKRLKEIVNRLHPNAEGRPQVAAGGSDLTQDETPDGRRARIKARHQELKAGGNLHPTKTVAEEERISEGRVRQLMKPARPVPKAQ